MAQRDLHKIIYCPPIVNYFIWTNNSLYSAGERLGCEWYYDKCRTLDRSWFHLPILVGTFGSSCACKFLMNTSDSSKGPFAFDDNDVFFCRHVWTVTLVTMQPISNCNLKNLCHCCIVSSNRVGGRKRWHLCGRLRWPSFIWLIFAGLGDMTPQAPWNHYIITRFAIRRGQVFHLKWWCLYLDIICSCKTRVLIKNISHLFQVKQKKLFYLFRPFTAVLWHALLGVFVLSTISYIFLQYFASKLRNAEQNKWLQNCKSATWQVAQIWLLQGKFYPTRLTSHGQSFFLSIYSMASVCSLTHSAQKVKIKFKTNSHISWTDYIKNKQIT